MRLKKKGSDELFKELESSKEGLNTAVAACRLEKCGPNAIEEIKKSISLKFLHYFLGSIPWMIEIAAILSLAVHHYADFYFVIEKGVNCE